MPRKVKFVRVVLIDRGGLPGEGRPPISHIVALDSRGRLWERYNDMPDGKWVLVEAPDDAQAEGRKRPRKS